MFAVDFAFGVVLYAAVGMLVVAAAWCYSDRRDRQFFDRTRRRTTFHCLKCSHVYSHSGDGEIRPCPRCGHDNPRLRF